MPAAPFPFEYIPEHPFLHRHNLKLYNIFLFFVCYIPAVFLAPLKLLSVLTAFGFSSFLMGLVDRGTDRTKPLAGFRFFLFRLFWVIGWRLTILSQFMLIIPRNLKNKDKTAQTVVSNHQNMNDVCIHGILLKPIYLARSDMIKSFGVAGALKCTRSLSVEKTASNASLLEDMKKIIDKFPEHRCPLQIFPEGTISAAHCLIRFRPGAFKIAGTRIQPVAIKYRTLLPSAWLCESGMRHVLDLSCNLCAVAEYIYLPSFEVTEEDLLDVPSESRSSQSYDNNQTNIVQKAVCEANIIDKCGKMIADALKIQYLPYNNVDYLYFSGKLPDTKKCSPEYIKDFGWMGQFKDYEGLCFKARVSPRYFYSKEFLAQRIRKNGYNVDKKLE